MLSRADVFSLDESIRAATLAVRMARAPKAEWMDAPQIAADAWELFLAARAARTRICKRLANKYDADYVAKPVPALRFRKGLHGAVRGDELTLVWDK